MNDYSCVASSPIQQISEEIPSVGESTENAAFGGILFEGPLWKESQIGTVFSP
jgi:hypothetical protein